MTDEKIVAIIPARGGSKSIPRKNIKSLDDKPLIYYSIGEALKSDYVDRVIVSTEDDEIAGIAKEYGAEVMKRPQELAQDDTPVIDVLFHVLEVLKKEDWNPDVLVLLQPTSPLRVIDDINNAIELHLKGRHRSVVSVSEVSHSPFWSFRIEKEALVPLFEKRYLKMRKQELPKVYAPNGAVFVSSAEGLHKNKSFYTQRAIPYVMPAERSIDIDQEIDFLMAELMMRNSRSIRR